LTMPKVRRGDWRRFVVEDGDLLISRASGSLDRLGLAGRAQVPTGVTRLFPDLLYRIRPRRDLANSRFLLYVLVSSFARAQYIAARRGAANNKLRIEDVANLRVPVRSTHEQQAIVDFLDRECERIANLDARLQSFLTVAAESWGRRSRDAIPTT
jgi:restriction endonuclease S subunit